MPVGAFVPSRIHLDYPEWQAPLIGNVGQVWAYTGSGYAPVALDFDPAGTAAAAVAAHVGLSNPHSQYYLASGVSGFGATLASAADAAAARTALALGTAAIYNVGTSANNVVQLDGSARLPAVDGSQLTGISGGSVAGSNTQVIINDGGVYAGDPGLTYAKATDRLTVVGGIIAGDWSPPSDSTTAVSIWNAARSTRVLTVDTTNKQIGINVAPTSTLDVSAPAISGRERFIKFAVSDAARDVMIMQNATSANARFSPLFIGAAESTPTIPGIGFAGAINTSGDTGTVALINLFAFRYTDGGDPSTALQLSVTTRPIFSIANVATSFLLISATGNVGLQNSSPTAVLDIAASTTTRASLRIRAGTAPTTPNAGDIWYPTGGRLNVYRAATETIASGVPGTGGAATATGTWGATEQAMLQAVYDIARSFGMLS